MSAGAQNRKSPEPPSDEFDVDIDIDIELEDALEDAPASDADDQRDEQRYRHLVPVVRKGPGAPVALSSLNISSRGMYIRSVDAPNEGDLIDLRISLGPHGGEIDVVARVAHVEPPTPFSETPPGFGVQFFQWGPEARERWRAYIHRVASISEATSPATSGVIAKAPAGTDEDSGPATRRVSREPPATGMLSKEALAELRERTRKDEDDDSRS